MTETNIEYQAAGLGVVSTNAPGATTPAILAPYGAAVAFGPVSRAIERDANTARLHAGNRWGHGFAERDMIVGTHIPQGVPDDTSTNAVMQLEISTDDGATWIAYGPEIDTASEFVNRDLGYMVPSTAAQLIRLKLVSLAAAAPDTLWALDILAVTRRNEVTTPTLPGMTADTADAAEASDFEIIQGWEVLSDPAGHTGTTHVGTKPVWQDATTGEFFYYFNGAKTMADQSGVGTPAQNPAAPTIKTVLDSDGDTNALPAGTYSLSDLVTFYNSLSPSTPAVGVKDIKVTARALADATAPVQYTEDGIGFRDINAGGSESTSTADSDAMSHSVSFTFAAGDSVLVNLELTTA